MSKLTHSSAHPIAIPATLNGVSRAFFEGVTGLVDTALLWNRRYNERIRLRDTPDHLLADMGISRFDADAESAKPFWRD